jgi:hypothetical protein
MTITLIHTHRLAPRGVLLVVVTSLLWLVPQPRAQSKTACELIPLADISAAFGVEMFLRPTRPQPPENCAFASVGPFDRPTGPVVNLLIHWSHAASPDKDAMVDEARTLLQQRRVRTTNVANVGDAAFWFGNDMTGELHVFRGGIDTLVLAGQLPLEKMKALAAKALGGSGRTGFAYTSTDSLNRPGPTAVAAAESPLVGGGSFSQALYVTQGEFLKQIKEVSLSVDPSPQLAKFMPPAQQRDYVTKALASRGITVRAWAPVALLATIDELDSTGVATTTSSRSGTSTEKFEIHNVFVSLDFYVRAVVMRNGQAHLVTVAPARGYQMDQYVEDNELRKAVFGNPTVHDMKELVAWLLDDVLDRIATNYAVDSTPWYATGWSAAQKTAADAEFLRLLNSGQRPDAVQTSGLDTTPRMETYQPAIDDPDEACPSPDGWSAAWNAQFQRARWTRAASPSPLAIRDSFHCRHIAVVRFSSGYYRLVDDVSLREANAVFVLNGRVFRKPATLLSMHRRMTPSYSTSGDGTLKDALAAAEQTFVPQSTNEFMNRLGQADTRIPVIPATPVRIVAGTTSPDNAAARATVFHPDGWERRWDVPFYPVSKYTPDLAKKGRLILQGVVARISMDGQYPQWLRIYFKESPDSGVTLCTPSADIFDDFGEGYKGLIGRTVEAAGDIDTLCTPKGGIRILESAQFRSLSNEPGVP